MLFNGLIVPEVIDIIIMNNTNIGHAFVHIHYIFLGYSTDVDLDRILYIVYCISYIAHLFLTF